MGELSESTELLEEVKAKERELEELKGKLNKKDAGSAVVSLQTLVIKYQRSAIETLLRIQGERDKMGDYWEHFIQAVILCREAVEKAETSIKDAESKKIRDLTVIIESKDKVITSLNEEVSLLKTRVRNLLGN